MKAEEKKFLHFLGGTDKNFIIPVYQRNYDWKKEQCKQLFDDLVEIVHSDFRTHFLGTIVAYNDDGYGEQFLIIDGQQRLTTLSILLLAIYKLLEKGDITSEYVNKDKIYKTYLINEFSNDQKKIRLKPIKDDREAFESIFNGEVKENSNITINFDYFTNRILTNEISIDDLYKAIEKLIIVEILLRKGEDDPQLIFESLNSTGLDLSEADKVRNFILMKQSSDKQEELYNNFWSKIEKNTGFKVSEFIRDYLILKERKIPNQSKVYVVFKEYVIKNRLSIENILSELLTYSNYYNKILFSNDEDKEIKKILKRLNNLEVFVMFPFLLELYEDKNNGYLKNEEFKETLNILESYIFRRFICEVPTNVLNKIFMTLGKEIKIFPDFKENYFEVFKRILLNKIGVQRFPDNNEFKNYLLNKDIYNTQSKNRLYLLERLESNNSKESYVGNLISEGVLTIEHIMPQTLTPDWKKDLGENNKEIHSKYLHTLGNITLTGYNSKYSNKTFKEKKSIENGFLDSPLFLNNYIKNCTNWTEKEILERYNILKDKALKTWILPISNYEIKKDMTKFFILNDENSFTGEKIESFIIFGEKYNVRYWSEMYEIVIKKIYELDPLNLKKVVNENYYEKRQKREITGSMNIDEQLSTIFFNSPKKNINTLKISEDFYTKISLSVSVIFYILRAVFDKSNIEYSELEFYIK